MRDNKLGGYIWTVNGKPGESMYTITTRSGSVYEMATGDGDPKSQRIRQTKGELPAHRKQYAIGVPLNEWRSYYCATAPVVGMRLVVQLEPGTEGKMIVTSPIEVLEYTGLLHGSTSEL